ERRAAHAFGPASQHQTGFSSTNGARRRTDCIQPGTTQAVDGRARYFSGQTSQQGRHACHVAVVFTRLVRAAEENIVDRVPVDGIIAFHQGTNHDGAKVIGPHTRKCAAVTTKWCADAIAYESLLRHVGSSWIVFVKF